MVAAPTSSTGAGSTHPVTISMTVVIHRALAGYCAFSLAVSLPTLLAQLTTTAGWWSMLFVPVFGVLVVGMVVRSIRRESIARWAAAYAGVCVLALLTGYAAFAPRTDHSASWLWWLLGVSTVTAGVGGGIRVAAGYSLVISLLYGCLRTQPEFGAAGLEVGISDGLFLVVAGLPLAVTALGMMRAGAAADQMAAEVSRRELDEELGRVMSVERSRLDRLIHDDVLTTLTAAAHADDDLTVAAARELSVTTLHKVAALHDEVRAAGQIPGDVLLRLAEETVARITPVAELRADGVVPLVGVAVSSEGAEAVLAAVREAVRNAVRHARATSITVLVRTTDTVGTSTALTFEIVDDGRGFEPDAVDDRRLGVRLSILARLDEVGGSGRIDSTPGAGTTVTVTIPLQSNQTRRPVTDDPPAVALPAEFPVTLLIVLTWLLVAVQVGQGLYYEREMAHPWASSSAMVLAVSTMAVLLHGGSQLRLPRWGCIVAVLLVPMAGALSAHSLPSDHWPGYGLWLPFVLQFMIVIVILRQRLGTAVLILVGAGLPLTGWAVTTTFVWQAVSTVHLGAVMFAVMAWFVNRGLLTIARRQVHLHRQEAAALRQAARRYVGRVQRALWVDDIRISASDLLYQVAAAQHPLSTETRAECLLVEATLRESLLARNVTNEELAELTEDARRRGVSVTYVDSRHTPASTAVRLAVLAEMTRVLRSRSVSRVVVRVAPDESEQAASVMADDGASAEIVTIDQRGVSSSDGV